MFPEILDNYGTCHNCKHSFDDHRLLAKSLYLACKSCDCQEYRDKLLAWVGRGFLLLMVIIALLFWAFIIKSWIDGVLF